MRSLRPVLLIILAAAVSSSAAAQPTGKDKSTAQALVDVETAEQLYVKLDYDKAYEVAERVTRQSGLSHDQLVRAYRVLAVTCAILDKEEQARDAFLQLLVFDPEYTVDTNLGPKVSSPFVEARGQFRSLPSKPGMDVVPNIRSDGGKLRVTTHDPTRIVKTVSVGYRWTSAGEYTVSQINVGDGIVEVGPATQGRTRLDFYAQAFDDRDNTVFEAGNAQVPKSSFAEAAPRGGSRSSGNKGGGSVFSSPVFWIVTGAIVAGAGTTLFLVLRPEDPPTRAALTPRILCGDELCR